MFDVFLLKQGLMKTVKEVSILIGVSMIAALGVNLFSPRGIALVGQWDTSLGVVNAREKNDVVMDQLEIDDVTDAKTLYDSGFSSMPSALPSSSKCTTP